MESIQVKNSQERKRVYFCGPQSVTSGILHFGGMLLSVVGLILLLALTAQGGHDPWKLVSFGVYGTSMVLLYGASGTYHTFYISEKVHRALRKIDHSMVFVLIAGSYMPLCMVAMRGPVGWTVFGLVCFFTVAGIVMKMFWIDAPKWVSALLYVLLGWMIVGVFFSLKASLSPQALAWLFLGGLLYTVGAVIYAVKKEWICTKYFGNHELFHIFILLGSACHYILMLGYIR